MKKARRTRIMFASESGPVGSHGLSRLAATRAARAACQASRPAA